MVPSKAGDAREEREERREGRRGRDAESERTSAAVGGAGSLLSRGRAAGVSPPTQRQQRPTRSARLTPQPLPSAGSGRWIKLLKMLREGDVERSSARRFR